MCRCMYNLQTLKQDAARQARNVEELTDQLSVAEGQLVSAETSDTPRPSLAPSISLSLRAGGAYSRDVSEFIIML